MKVFWRSAILNIMIAGMLCLLTQLGAAELHLDYQRTAMNLAGSWERLSDHADEELAAVTAHAGWQAIDLPAANLMPQPDGNDRNMAEVHKQTACVWVRRSFQLDGEEAARQAVLKWSGIRFGATAWINGQLITSHVPIGPHSAHLDSNVLQHGNNSIVLKIPGWNGIPKSKSGYPLLPVGGATQSWGSKAPGVFGDIWLEFYDDVYLERAQARSDIRSGSVLFDMRLYAQSVEEQSVELDVQIVRGDNQQLVSRQHSQTLKLTDARTSAQLRAHISNPVLWTPQHPFLYEVQISVRSDAQLCDVVRFHFGMREISVKDGHYQLNGKPLWLRGSTLLNEWLWGETFNQQAKQYLIDHARSMNFNVMRTHTCPLPSMWADIADAHGMMIMAEMPLLYNHGDFGYTAAEYEILHQHTLSDTRAWIEKLCNHPSVIMWVISNESHLDNEWESTVLYRDCKQNDPTRPVMRTGEDVVGTPDALDVHTCFNVVRGPEGELQQQMTDLMQRKDPKRPLCNTEYMNRMWGPGIRWLGDADHPDQELVYAECAVEHTEAMRRLSFDCILPYMYAGWTGMRKTADEHWRSDYPTPMAAACHSAMSPLLASIDLFDRNHVAGSRIDVPIVLINESNASQVLYVDIYVTPEDPLFVPDQDALSAAVLHQSRLVYFGPNTRRRTVFTLEMPEVEGSYYLAAVIRPRHDRPVISQRVVRAIKPLAYADELSGRHVLLLGGSDPVRRFLDRHRVQCSEWIRAARIDSDVVIVDDPSQISYITRPGVLRMLQDYISSGGRLVVLRQEAWPEAWRALIDCHIGLPEYRHLNPVRCSRLHRFKDASHKILRDLPYDWLWRWNGLPGTVMNECILESSPALQQSQQLLWGGNPKFTAVLSYPLGKGEIVMNQLFMRERINPGDRHYDPAAERLLINMLRP